MTDLPDNNPKSALGALKIDLSLVPPSAVIAEARVMALGAKKYGPYNWREKTVSARVYTAAALRHIFTWQDGEDIDPESGESHLAHARACLGILLDAKSIGKLNDNRPVAGAAGRLLVPSPPPAAVVTPVAPGSGIDGMGIFGSTGPLSIVHERVLKCVLTGKYAPVAFCICEVCGKIRSDAATGV